MTLDAPPDVRAMWFEDFRPGQRFATGSRTVTAEDLRAFTALSGDAHPVHVDAAGAAAAGFDQPILQGPFGLAAFFGLFHETGISRDSLVALLDTRWRYHAPIRVGDSLTASILITRCRRTSRGDTGVVGRYVEVTDRTGRLVQSGSTAYLVRARDGASDEVGREFFSTRWARAIASRLDADPAFSGATATWDGAIGLRCGDETAQFRVYRGRVLEGSSRTPAGPTFCLEADERVWAELLTGPINDLMIRLMRADEFRTSGNAYEYLRLTRAVLALVDVIRTFATEEIPA